MPLTQKRDVNFKAEFGVVYTPASLSQFVADKVMGYFLEDLSVHKRAKKLKIIDPACGEGELLLASWKSLVELNPKFSGSPEEVLCGIDVDKYAIDTTKRNISSLGLSDAGEIKVIKTNALFPENTSSNISDWDAIKEKFGAYEGFDVLIANPPWGADMTKYAEQLRSSDYKLRKGQFDSSDLFVELALRIVKEDGYFAFIIPDSLFSHERKALRRMLAEESEIKYIARLGEKIFEGINRACTVVICRKKVPDIDNQVTCMRLNNKMRKLILNNQMSFADADEALNHQVPQKRFSDDKDFVFDIETREEDKKVLDKIISSGKVIGDYVFSSRGVELSKTGKVYKCKKCEHWNPYPNVKVPKCNHCGEKADMLTVEKQSIVSKQKHKGYKPLLVGESIRRYSISSQYWISVNNEGINYKNISIYYEPKIIVRKTGVGITASIDYSNSLTNQVVYMFRPRVDTDLEPVPIELILAIMNSRATYYYLLKRFGESEWRSHPYLTQSQILNLPLPNLLEEKYKSVGEKIVSKVKPYLEKGKEIPKKVDAEVERLVAELFELSRGDYEVVYSTLAGVENLIPVKALTEVKVEDIFR